jgi:hypothetical protein
MWADVRWRPRPLTTSAQEATCDIAITLHEVFKTMPNWIKIDSHYVTVLVEFTFTEDNHNLFGFMYRSSDITICTCALPNAAIKSCFQVLQPTLWPDNIKFHMSIVMTWGITLLLLLSSYLSRIPTSPKCFSVGSCNSRLH